MSEMGNYLRLMVNGDREAVVSAVTVTDVPTKFVTGLTTEHSRKRITIHNNSDTNSGELCYGFSADITAGSGSMPIVTGEYKPVAVAKTIDIYLVAPSGETLDARIEEIA